MDRLPAGLKTSLRRSDWPLLLADLAGIVVVPLALAGLQFVGPPGLLDLLTFSSTEQTLHGLFGHWMVHYSGLLLLENAAGYLLFTGMAYLLAWSIDERRWFRLSVATVLVVVPPVSAFASAWGFEVVAPELAYRSRGASAVVAGVLGLVYAFGLGAICRTYDLRATISLGGAILVGALSILLLRIGAGSQSAALVLSGVAVAIVLFDATERWIRNEEGLRLQLPSLAAAGSVSIAVFLLMGLAFPALFPADPFTGTTITNVFAHATGFVLGVTIGIWGRRYWATGSWI